MRLCCKRNISVMFTWGIINNSNIAVALRQLLIIAGFIQYYSISRTLIGSLNLGYQLIYLSLALYVK